MVNEEKVKLMTKLAIFESNEGKKQMPLCNYYKKDYVKLNVLKTIIFATIGYFLIVLGYFVVDMESLLSRFDKLNYKNIAILLIVGYILFILFYFLVAKVYYSKKYEKAKSNLTQYNSELKKLKEYYNSENIKKDERGVIEENDEFIDVKREY